MLKRTMVVVAGVLALAAGCGGGTGNNGGTGGGSGGTGGGSGGSGGAAGNVCGDDIIGGVEDCDGIDLGSATCESLGAAFGGSLACTGACAFDVSGCSYEPTCGDGTVQGTEQCDTDLTGLDCTTQGFTGGTLACTGCLLDFSGCTGGATQCGDNQLNGLEQCDGPDLGTARCDTVGFLGGDLACSANCTFDTGACLGGPPVCGNGIAEGSEACDTGDLLGKSCVDAGFVKGTLACTGSCRLDTSGCSNDPLSRMEELVVSFCGLMATCGGGSATYCEAVTFGCDADVGFPDMSVSFSDMTLTEQQACLNMIAGLTCADLQGPPPPPTGCPLVPPRGAVGDPCEGEWQCDDGLICDTFTTANCGVCAAPSQSGEGCSWNRHCAAGLACDQSTNPPSCATPPVENAACAFGMWPSCQPGLYCDGQNCIAQAADGQPCTNHSECLGWCDASINGGTCAPLRADGDACVENAECTDYCEFDRGLCYNGSVRAGLGESCLGNSCEDALACVADVCVARVDIDESCTGDGPNSDCLNGLVCVLGACRMFPGTGCNIPGGQICVGDEHCGAGQYCASGNNGPPVCATKKVDGAQCDWRDSECAAGLFCLGNIGAPNSCGALRAVGGDCLDGGDCVSTYCDWGAGPTCADPPVCI